MAAESKQYTLQQENRIIAIGKFLLPLIVEGETSFEPIVVNSDRYIIPSICWGMRCEGGNLYPIAELLGDKWTYFEQLIHWCEYEFERDVLGDPVKRPIPLIPETELHWMFEQERFIVWRNSIYRTEGRIPTVHGYLVRRIKELFDITIS